MRKNRVKRKLQFKKNADYIIKLISDSSLKNGGFIAKI